MRIRDQSVGIHVSVSFLPKLYTAAIYIWGLMPKDIHPFLVIHVLPTGPVG